MNNQDTPLIIRKATVDDAELITQFVHKLITELDGKKPMISIHSSIEICKTILSNKRNACFIAQENNTEIGIITVVESIALYTGGVFGIINELYVLPPHRSNGAGSLLIQAAVQFGKQNSWKRLEVGAPPKEEWRKTIHFYLREGFIEIGPRLKKILS
jgi:GNAT superfamily N-acetyltransferase